MIVFALGASRNIGYHATLKLLAKGATIVYLLRSVATLENDPAFKQYLDNGKAKLIKGDATSYDDVSNAWKAAITEGQVDLILFTVGGTTGRFHPIKGVVMTPHDLCTHSILNTLRAVLASNSPTPKVVVLSSTGLTPRSKAALPLLLRPVYAYLLRHPHVDKRGLEAVIHHAIGKPYEEGQTPGEEYLAAGWKDTIPEGSFKRQADGHGGAVVIRAAGLTDGDERGTVRAAPGDFSTYTVSRKDVGRFIAEDLLNDWPKYEGGVVTVGY